MASSEAPRSFERLPGVRLRPVEPADRPWLRELYGTTRSAELDLTAWDEDTRAAFLNLQFEAQQRDYRGRFPAASFDVIERDGDPVGRLYVDRSGGETRILDITLLPAYRGRGLGSALLKALLQESAAEGRPVTLHVEQNNPARRLYERLGFEMVVDEGVYHLMLWVPPVASRGARGPTPNPAPLTRAPEKRSEL